MKIFLGHASSDAHVADGIAVGLRQQGHQVFFDEDDLPSGESYDDRIRKAVAASDLFVFVVSPESVADGRYTRTELKFVRDRWPDPTGRILPVIVKPTPHESIPPYLLRVSMLKPEGDAIAEVAQAVDALSRGSQRRFLVNVFGVAGLAILLAGLAWFAFVFFYGTVGQGPGPIATTGQQQGYPIDCLGGGGMVAATQADGSLIITFAATAEGTATTPPAAGECGWKDRGFRAREPTALLYSGDRDGARYLLDQIAGGRPFAVMGYNNNQGAMTITEIVR